MNIGFNPANKANHLAFQAKVTTEDQLNKLKKGQEVTLREWQRRYIHLKDNVTASNGMILDGICEGLYPIKGHIANIEIKDRIRDKFYAVKIQHDRFKGDKTGRIKNLYLVADKKGNLKNINSESDYIETND